MQQIHQRVSAELPGKGVVTVLGTSLPALPETGRCDKYPDIPGDPTPPARQEGEVSQAHIVSWALSQLRPSNI